MSRNTVGGPWAVRNDIAGWRAVIDPEDVIDGLEFYLPADQGPPPDLIPLPMTAEQVLAERDRLLGIAAPRIAPLQDAVDLEIATADEVALLTKWKQYRVALNRLQEQQGYPASITWPVAPDAADVAITGEVIEG